MKEGPHSGGNYTVRWARNNKQCTFVEYRLYKILSGIDADTQASGYRQGRQRDG